MKKDDMKVYAFVGPSGTGKSYRAQMVASEKEIHFIIDDGLLIKDNNALFSDVIVFSSIEITFLIVLLDPVICCMYNS